MLPGLTEGRPEALGHLAGASQDKEQREEGPAWCLGTQRLVAGRGPGSRRQAQTQMEGSQVTGLVGTWAFPLSHTQAIDGFFADLTDILTGPLWLLS